MKKLPDFLLLLADAIALDLSGRNPQFDFTYYPRQKQIDITYYEIDIDDEEKHDLTIQVADPESIQLGYWWLRDKMKQHS